MRSIRKSQIVGPLARRMLGVLIKYAAGAEIYSKGGPADYVYEVVKGAARTSNVLSDRRRQISGFYFAGDIVGVENGNEHSLSNEAVVPSTLRVVKRQTLVQLAADDHKLAEELLTTGMHEIARAHRHAQMLIMTAQERVSSFLVEMGERISVGDLIQLPMPRQDIADYLGLTIETISREIRTLVNKSTIYLPNSRTIMVRDRPALERGASIYPDGRALVAQQLLLPQSSNPRGAPLGSPSSSP